jgi:hypothetical protein
MTHSPRHVSEPRSQLLDKDVNDERTVRVPVLTKLWSLDRERDALTSTQHPEARHVDI